MRVDTQPEFREFLSTDEAEQWAKTHYSDLYGEQRKSNPDYERLFYYGGNCYKAYNKTLRHGWNCSDETKEEIAQLTDILERHILPESVIAYRHTHKEDVELLCIGERLRPGVRFADKAFFSTSLVKSSMDKFRKKHHCDCLLKLYLSKGLHGVYISLKETPSILNEQELLLQRNTEFEIIKIHRFCRPMVIECKAIINPTLEV